MDDSLSLLELTVEKQEHELTDYIKNYDSGFDKIMEISKLSLSESKMLKDKCNCFIIILYSGIRVKQNLKQSKIKNI